MAPELRLRKRPSVADDCFADEQSSAEPTLTSATPRFRSPGAGGWDDPYR